MRKSQVLIYICIIISLLNIFMIVFYLRHHDSTVLHPSETLLPAEVPGSSDIFLPSKIDLAGEETPLQRQDVQEALKKELIVNTYLHSHTIQILKNAPRVFAIIEPILKAKVFRRISSTLPSSKAGLIPWSFLPPVPWESGRS